MDGKKSVPDRTSINIVEDFSWSRWYKAKRVEDVEKYLTDLRSLTLDWAMRVLTF
jgi:hypothetical protein